MRRRKRPGEDRDARDAYRGPGICPVCEEPKILECVHLMGAGHGGGVRMDVPLNMLGCCHECHMAAHNGKTHAKIFAAKAALEKMSVEQLRDRLHELQKQRCDCGRIKRVGRKCCDRCYEYS